LSKGRESNANSRDPEGESGRGARSGDGAAENLAAPSSSSSFWLLMILLVVAAVVLYTVQRNRPSQTPKFVGKPLPPLTVASWANTEKPLAPADLRGRVVFVDFWTSTCGPCLAHTQDLVAYHRRFRDQGVLMISFTPEPGGPGTRPQNYIETVDGFDWPSAFGAHMVLEMMGIYATPTYILYDKAGNSIWGGHSLEGLDDATIAALAK